MIVFDTETTGLVKPEAVPLADQPKIIEFAAVKLNDALEEVGHVNFFVHPRQPLPPKIVEITGITDAMLQDARPFSAYYGTLCDFFLGERVMVAHNVDYDRSLLRFELMRLGALINFPWPPRHLCTVELGRALMGIANRPRLGELYAHCFQEPMPNAHRALDDTRNLVKCVRVLRAENFL